jgi:Ca2+-binding EF-hand superfamily protein
MNKHFRITILAIAAFFAAAVLCESAFAQGWRGGGGGGGGDRGSRFGRGPGGGGNGGWPGGGERGRDRDRDGERRDEKEKEKSSSSSSDSKSSGSSSASMSNADYAKGVVEQHDKNKDKMLQKDEQSELRGKLKDADLDTDGVITIEEMTRHLDATAVPAPASSATSGDQKSDKGGDKGKHGESPAGQRVYTWTGGGSKEAEKRKSYRFTTAADQLPKDLPGFFSRDANGDGQVSMSEFSRNWSKSTVSEFRKYDLNDDGIITAREAGGKKPETGG